MRAAACHSGKGRAAIEWESILKDLRKKKLRFFDEECDKGCYL